MSKSLTERGLAEAAMDGRWNEDLDQLEARLCPKLQQQCSKLKRQGLIGMADVGRSSLGLGPLLVSRACE